ncbi:hypothetical protein HJC23_005434 [Cyclotella cryptica]|uniref:Uncharacterized protein n=1 Tax=Cyclotella cryptica TaxID=29204 RepID=A0ABD3P4M4_9STRA|eukprot:CCRYP_017901-RB/>CCRYP_017901-RB protein AED:0.04 eAED:0.04 QI:184/1/1/1/0.33/0.25/4/1541/285
MNAKSSTLLAVIAVAIFSSTQAYQIAFSTATVARCGRSSQSLYSLKISSSSFFGIGATRRSLQLAPSNSLHLSSAPNSDNTVDVEIQSAKSRVANESDSAPSSTSLLQTIDKLGMKLKPWALAAHEKSIQIRSSRVGNSVNGNDGSRDQGSMFKSIFYAMKSNFLWMLYIFYRGYRGFFVILPAVFREVFRQLEESNVVVDAFDEVNTKEVSSSSQHQSMRLRTRITVSVLSGILTLSYVISGAFRVLGKFIKTFTSTTSVEESLHAAADEVELNEDKLRKNKGR